MCQNNNHALGQGLGLVPWTHNQGPTLVHGCLIPVLDPRLGNQVWIKSSDCGTNRLTTRATDRKLEVVLDELVAHVGEGSLEEAGRAQHQHLVHQAWEEPLQTQHHGFNLLSSMVLIRLAVWF